MQQSGSLQMEIGTIEELFTLGLFRDAYKAGEEEILKLLVFHSLPRSLLPPRLPSLPSLSSSASSSSTLSNSVSSSTSNSQASRESTKQTNSAIPASSPTWMDNGDPLVDSSESMPPYETNTTKMERSQRSGLATSSSPPKAREYSYETLVESDQRKLRVLTTEAMGILAVMIQCLYELDEKSQIVPFVQMLCGSRYEEYPFELAYLVINLFVSMKEIERARKATESVLSSLRSQLGPLPLKSPTLRNNSSSPKSSELMPQETTMSSPAKVASGSSSDSQASSSGLSMDEEYDWEVDELTMSKRQHFESLLQLYIFHIMCTLHLFADAKSYLFLEARISPKLVQQWIYYVDELEGAYMEETKTAEAEKRSLQLSQPPHPFQRPSTSDAPSYASPTPRTVSSSWWHNIMDDDWEAKDDQQITPFQSRQTPLKSRPIYLIPLRYIIKITRSIMTRYQHLSEPLKTTIKFILVLASFALTYVLASSKWLKSISLSKWIGSKLIKPSIAGGTSQAQFNSQSAITRGLLGSSYSNGPRFR